MKHEWLYIVLFLTAVFITSISQIILKMSANKKHGNIIKEYLNVPVISAYGLFFSATFITVFSYTYLPLSTGVVLGATGYLWVSLFGVLWLKEKINKKKIFGLLLIIVGIFIFHI